MGTRINTCIVESCNYAPLLYILALGKTGEGAYLWDSDIYNATWVCDLCTFSGCLMGKTREKQQSKIYDRNS